MTPKMAGTIVVLIMIAVAIPMFIRTAIWNRFLKYMKQDKDCVTTSRAMIHRR